MDALAVPTRQSAQLVVYGLEHYGRVLEVGLALLVYVQILVVGGELFEEVDLLGYIGQLGGALFEDSGELEPVDGSAAQSLVEVRRGNGGELFVGHGLDVLAVEPLELVIVEHGRRLADTADVEDLAQLSEGEYLAVLLGAPAQQGDVVDDRLGQIAVVDQVLKAG